MSGGKNVCSYFKKPSLQIPSAQFQKELSLEEGGGSWKQQIWILRWN